MNPYSLEGVVIKDNVTSIISKIKSIFIQERNLVGANLIGANWAGKDLSKCDLRRANLTEADLKGAQLTLSSLAKTKFDKADLTGANLAGANIDSATFKESCLINANLKDARLEWADLRGANLTNANLEGAFLYNARLDDAILDNANITNIEYNNWTTWPTGFIPSEKLMTMLPKNVSNSIDLILFLKQLSQSKAIDYKETLPKYLKSLVLIIEETKNEPISAQYIARLFNDAFYQDSTKFDNIVWEGIASVKSSNDSYQEAQQILIEQITYLNGLSESQLLRHDEHVHNFIFSGIEAIEDITDSHVFGWADIIEIFKMAAGDDQDC